MGAYTVQFWGINLTESYSKIEKVVGLDPENEELDEDNDIIELSDYLHHHKLGRSLYDGAGWGQITFIGVALKSSARGVVVTDEHVAEVADMVRRIPEELKNALIEVYGSIPEPSFHTEEGWG